MGYNKQGKGKEGENKQRDKNRRVERIFHKNVRRSRGKSNRGKEKKKRGDQQGENKCINNMCEKREGMARVMERGCGSADSKEGRGRKSRGDRGITIMSASYKVYATTLAVRLRRDVEEKEIIPQN